MEAEEPPKATLPNLRLAQLRFLAARGNEEAKNELLQAIKEESLLKKIRMNKKYVKIQKN